MIINTKKRKNAIKSQEILAISRNVLIAPTKLNKIINKIRGKSYFESLKIFKNTPQKAGRTVWNTLNSAVANAMHNFGFQKNELVISKAFANQGSILKRTQPRAKGKAYKIERKLSHVTICVSKL